MKAGDIVYISGPMTGYPEDNRPAFRAAAASLRGAGARPISPDELDDFDPLAEAPSWAAYLRRDLRHLSVADACLCLPGWRGSKGATLEVAVLAALSVPIWELQADGSTHRIPPDETPTICHPFGKGPYYSKGPLHG